MLALNLKILKTDLLLNALTDASRQEQTENKLLQQAEEHAVREEHAGKRQEAEDRYDAIYDELVRRGVKFHYDQAGECYVESQTNSEPAVVQRFAGVLLTYGKPSVGALVTNASREVAEQFVKDVADRPGEIIIVHEGVRYGVMQAWLVEQDGCGKLMAECKKKDQ